MQALNIELSNLTGVQVELVQPQAGHWLAAPKDRALLRAKLWQALRVGPAAGIGKTPTAAAMLLARAAGASGARAVTKQERARAWLKQVAAGAPVTASDIKVMAEADGQSWAAIDRAARALDVERMKCGLQGPWVRIMR